MRDAEDKPLTLQEATECLRSVDLVPPRAAELVCERYPRVGAIFRPGDRLYEYDNMRPLAGHAGYLVVRDGTVMEAIAIIMG